MSTPASDVVVSLDFPDRGSADRLINALGDSASWYKIGIQTLVAAGPGLVTDLVDQGKQVFLDLKLHEIPNSVAGAVSAAGDRGASMVTVHASGGARVLEAAVRAAEPYPQLHVLALTVITSLADDDMPTIGVPSAVVDQVDRLASLAVGVGCDGAVCSVQEVAQVKAVWGGPAVLATPGLGLTGDGRPDQVRTGTPEHARQVGATHAVFGRSITQSSDPVAALHEARRRFGL